MIRVYRDAEAFIKFINETFPKSVLDERSDLEYALWASAIQQAESILDSNPKPKDVAQMLIDGVKSLRDNPIESIQLWLDDIYYDLNAVIEGGEVELVDGSVTEEQAECYNVFDMNEMFERF